MTDRHAIFALVLWGGQIEGFRPGTRLCLIEQRDDAAGWVSGPLCTHSGRRMTLHAKRFGRDRIIAFYRAAPTDKARRRAIDEFIDARRQLSLPLPQGEVA